MSFSRAFLLLGLFLVATQQAQADIPNPEPNPVAFPFVLCGVCLSLAVAFFGLWLVTMLKHRKPRSLAPEPKLSVVRTIVRTINEFDPRTNQN